MGEGLHAVNIDLKLTAIEVSPRRVLPIENDLHQCSVALPHRALEFTVEAGTSEIRPTAYSARGSAVTTLVLGSGTLSRVPSAGVIASGWPSWATAFSLQRLSLKWIILHDVSLMDPVKAAFRNVEVLLWKELDLAKLQTVDIVGFNSTFELDSAQIKFGSLYFWDWKVRYRWKSWTFITDEISHAECGGVSDFKGSVTIATRNKLQIPAEFHVKSPPGEVGSILGGKTGGKELVKAPVLHTLVTPIVKNIGGHCYHPRGLYPLQDKKATVLTRYVFGTQSQWVERALTSEELLQVYDFPPQVYGRWSKELKRHALSAVQVPIKVLVAVVTTIVVILGLQVGGGETKSREKRADKVDVELEIDKEVCVDVAVEKEACGEVDVNEYSVEEVGATDDLPANWREGTQVVTSEAATKADDAEVPIYLWNDRLMEDLGLEGKCSAKQCQALEVIRRGVLSHWRYRLTRCFCRWLRCPECAFLKSDVLYKVYSTELPEKEARRAQPLLSPKWKGCDRCEKFERRKVWKFEDYACSGRGGYVWKEAQGASKEVRYDETAYGGKGGFIWCSGGMEQYKKWRRVFNTSKLTGMEDSIAAGVDCITRATKASAWEWDGGSRPFFWRWGREYWREARDGAKVWVKGNLPTCKEKQRVPRDAGIFAQVKKKVDKVRQRGYLGGGLIKSLTSFFEVMKGLSDIRMVYNATSSGLNDAVWAPWFSLPTVESHLRAVDVDTFMADNDIGEMFLNFMLDVELRPFAGVDLSLLFPEEMFPGVSCLYERWERMLMGFRPSPYLTTRDMMRLEPLLKGCRLDPNNVFRWEKAILNLPGMGKYQPGKPWLYRVRKDGTMAADLFIYIDDLRPTGPSKKECWDAAHQVGSRLTWFGLQDAARKRRDASQTPGAWAGTVIHTDGEEVLLLVSQDKWDKTRKWVQWMHKHTRDGLSFSHKELERCRGFLIYVSRTYRPFVPFLRGIHQTLESWREWRGADGWKMAAREIEYAMEQEEYEGPAQEQGARIEVGGTVKGVPRLAMDVEALSTLTKFEAPPKVVRRSKRTASAKYMGGDASGKGFGNALVVDGVCHAEFGSWSEEVEAEDSNFKELYNLVNAIENAYHAGHLKATELFVFTDNAVAEGAYYNGGSNRNKKLNALVFRLWNLQMTGDFTIHLFHIAGT